MIDRCLCIGAVLLCVIVGIGMHENMTMEDLAREAKHRDLQTGYVFDKAPLFGGEVSVNRKVADDGMAIIYNASNAKYSRNVIDFNKSKMIGNYVGTKAKQFVKGFVMGDKEPSKFDQ